MTRTFQSKPESHRLIAHSRQRRGEVLAVAGYSQVFNSNPRLDSAQTLILDDAHAGEVPANEMRPSSTRSNGERPRL
jgi:hypothetical protein